MTETVFSICFQIPHNFRTWSQKKKMASNLRTKRAPPVDDLGDWDEDCNNEEDGEEKVDAYD